MKKKLLQACLGMGLAGLATQALAAPFISFDPRSMAMGGAGVAVKDFNNAPIFNPAMMARLHEGDDFNMAFPIMGGRIRDQEDLIEVIDEDAENTINDLEVARDAVNNNFRTIVVPGEGTFLLPTSTQLLIASDAADSVNDLLQNIDGKAIDIEVGGALVVGIPSKKFGIALSLTGWSATSGIGDYQDATLLGGLTADARLAADRIGTLEEIVDTGVPQALDFNPATPCAGMTNFSDTCLVQFDENDIDSQVRAVGIAVGELGLTIAREFQIGSANLAVGITPKMVTVSTFDFVGDINTSELDDFGDSTKDDSNFNIDVGLAHSYENGWQVGLVFKNLISQEYEAPIRAGETEPFTVELKPQARGGVSYQNDWFLAAFDLDLIENDGVGFGRESQFMSFGMEFDAFDWAQLRVGYRSDLADSDRDPTLSAGFGLSPFGSFHFDFAVTADDFSDPSEVGAALQLAFTF